MALYEDYCTWRDFWASRTARNVPSMIDNIPAFLMTLANALRQRETRERIVNKNLPVHKFSHWIKRLRQPSCVVWILEILRLISKLPNRVDLQLRLPETLIAASRRMKIFPIATQFKIMAALLRLAQPEHALILLPTLRPLYNSTFCQHILFNHLLGTNPQYQLGLEVRDQLGLVQLPGVVALFVRHFLMRLAIYLVTCQCHGINLYELLDSSKVKVDMEEKVPLSWPFAGLWSIATVALFGEHEGLMYKFLTSLLMWECKTSLEPPIWSILLYKDFLQYYFDFDVARFCVSLERNFERSTPYLLSLYKVAGRESFLGEDHTCHFHQRLVSHMTNHYYVEPLIKQLSLLVL